MGPTQQSSRKQALGARRSEPLELVEATPRKHTDKSTGPADIGDTPEHTTVQAAKETVRDGARPPPHKADGHTQAAAPATMGLAP
ncbi:hypothetical protein KEM52_001964, partial [Ascosphaera acerosa]